MADKIFYTAAACCAMSMVMLYLESLGEDSARTADGEMRA